jgi:orotate phosphoribosyltransferase
MLQISIEYLYFTLQISVMMAKDRLIECFHKLGTIEYGNFILASGRQSHYKIYADAVLSDSEGRQLIADLALPKLPGREYKLAGVYAGGWEFAKILGLRTGKRAIRVDPHKRTINGDIVKGDYLVVCEDVTTSASSINKCIDLLHEHGGETDYALTIVERQEDAVDNLAAIGIRLAWLLTKADLDIE